MFLNFGESILHVYERDGEKLCNYNQLLSQLLNIILLGPTSVK